MREISCMGITHKLKQVRAIDCGVSEDIHVGGSGIDNG
jgi:hypothetical protein